MRTEDGYDDPDLGFLRANIEASSWTGRRPFHADWYDLSLLEPEGVNMLGANPRPGGLARLKRAVAAAEAELLPTAVEAVSAARTANLDWKQGPPLKAWTIVEVVIDESDLLWMSVYESVTDESSLWIVHFDVGHQPREVRRDGWGRSSRPLPSRGERIWAGITLPGDPE